MFFVTIEAIAKDQYQQYVVYKARYNAVCEAEFKRELDRGNVTQDDHDEFVRNYVNEEIVADLMSETMSSSELVEIFAGKLGKDDSNVIVSFLKRLFNGIKSVFNSKDEFPNKFSDIIGMFEGAVKNGVDNASDARYNNIRYKLLRLDGVNVFSPYNESGSDTNERATRWAHKREIEDYTQRIFYHENIRYLVEKDSSLSLGYRILKRVTNKEYAYLQKLNDVKTAMEDNYGRNTDRQQGNVRGIRADSGNREIAESPDRGNGNGGVADKHNGKTSSTQRLGGEQNAERRIDVERGRASERSVEDTQGKVKKKFALSSTVEKTPELNRLDSKSDSGYNISNNSVNNNNYISPKYETKVNRKHIVPIDFKEHNKRIAKAATQYGLSKDEARRLSYYVMGLCYKLNPKMVVGTLTDGELKLADDIRNALLKMPEYAGRTYRNLKFDNNVQRDEFLSLHSDGNIVELKAFTSASKLPNGYPLFGKGVVHLVIDDPMAWTLPILSDFLVNKKLYICRVLL